MLEQANMNPENKSSSDNKNNYNNSFKLENVLILFTKIWSYYDILLDSLLITILITQQILHFDLQVYYKHNQWNSEILHI